MHADAHHALLPRAPMARLAGLATELRTVRAELHAAAAEPPKGAPAAPGAAPAGGGAQQRRARRASQAPAAPAPALQAVRASCLISVLHRCSRHELLISMSRGLAARARAEARAPERGGQHSRGGAGRAAEACGASVGRGSGGSGRPGRGAARLGLAGARGLERWLGAVEQVGRGARGLRHVCWWQCAMYMEQRPTYCQWG